MNTETTEKHAQTLFNIATKGTAMYVWDAEEAVTNMAAIHELGKLTGADLASRQLIATIIHFTHVVRDLQKQIDELKE